MEKNFPGWQKGKKASSHIHALCPILEYGVLRVGGQLSWSSMPAEAKDPRILSKDLHISTLLLRHIHQKVGHGGRNYMLSKLLERYWITGASTANSGEFCQSVSLVDESILSQCLSRLADLHPERVTSDEPPFTRVGVDYFGPFEVRSRRNLVKRYGVIFT